MTYRVANTLERHIGGIVDLQRACFPPPFPSECLWQSEHIVSHLAHFPEGQFVVTFEGQVVASCTNMLISIENWDAHLDWQTATGGLALPKHNPFGQVLYGIDISVHPHFRKQGIAKRLYQARFEIIDYLQLKKFGTVCRIPGYRASGSKNSISYVEAVQSESTQDPTLTPLLKMKLKHVGIIPNYMEDQESGNAGVILEWNP